MPARSAAVTLVPDPPVPRGRLLSVDDVLALYPRGPGGRPIVSRWWVTHRFCPEGKMRFGRTIAWWERDALAWMDRQQAGAA